VNGDRLDQFTMVFPDETEFREPSGRGPEHAQESPDEALPPHSPMFMESPTTSSSSSAPASPLPPPPELAVTPAPPQLPMHPMHMRVQDGIVMPNPKYTGELELDELCLTAVEEFDFVDEALEQAAWRAAMEGEMVCIRDNET
jgi:hypothetical protein